MFTVDKFWELFDAASGDTVDGLTDALDSIAKDSKAKAQLYFDLVFSGAPPGNEDDWYRLRNFLMDWYAAHQSISSASTQISDPRTLQNPDLDELFRSFGYDFSTQLKGPDENPIDLKINFFLDLVNLYKRKGTPQSLVDVLQYYGVTKLDIYEFFIQRDSESSLIFEGNAIAGTTVNPSDLTFEYERLTEEDPHWLYTEQQILDLYDLNDINLPSKTPYLGIQPVASIDGAEIGILIRLVQDQFQYYLDNGVVPIANAEIGDLGEVVSLLELYLSIIYIFNKQFNVGQVGDSFICYDGTNTGTTIIIDEFETITARPQTRAGILTGLEEFYDIFTRETPRNFLQNRTDAGMYLAIINPALKNLLDTSTLTDSELLFSLLQDLSSWVRINLGFGFVNLGFITFGLDSFFEDLKPVINFFKPYRARLVLLELLQINNPLFNTIIVEDRLESIKVEFPIYDYLTGNGNPCCTDVDIDTTDCCVVCLNDSTSNLYYQRETYDCSSYYDVGAVTDMLQHDFFPTIYEIRHIPLVCIPADLDSTAIVYSEVLYGSMSSVTDGTTYTTIIDSTSSEVGDLIYEELTTGGFADFDEPGTFDCPTGFDEVYIKVYQESSPPSESPNDDFTGANDDPPNIDIWNIITGTPTIQNNELRLRRTQPAAWESDIITSKFVYSGDFDLQIDSEIYGSDDGDGIRIWTHLDGDIANIVSAIEHYRFSGWWLTYCVDGCSSTGTGIDSTERLRLTRVGSTLSTYRWNVSSWQLLKSATETTSPLRFSIGSYTPSSLLREGTVDDFITNSGETVWD